MTIALNINYELFNCNNFNICYRSWNYRGCWHQTFPPIVTRSSIYGELIPIVDPHMRVHVVIDRHYLINLTLGNLRACCLP